MRSSFCSVGQPFPESACRNNHGAQAKDRDQPSQRHRNAEALLPARLREFSMPGIRHIE